MLKRIGWFFFALFFYGVNVYFQIILGLTLRIQESSDFALSHQWLVTGIYGLLAVLGWSMAALAALFAYHFKLQKLDFSFIRKNLPLLLISYGSIYAVNIIASLVMYFEGKDTASNQKIIESLFGQVPASILFLMIVVMAPIIEEVLVRGIIPNLIFKRGSILGYVVGGFVFAALHSPDSVGAWLVYGGMSAVLTFAAYKTKRLEASWLLHVVMNSMSFIVIWLGQFF